MIRWVFNGETVGDSADETRALSLPEISEQGADEIVDYVRSSFVEPFDRGNAGVSVSFRVVQLYGTMLEASLALLERTGQLVRQATLDCVITASGETVTLRMANALRRPVKGVFLGLSVQWDFEFTGAQLVRVETPAGAPDYYGGVCNSGDAFTRFYWGGVCGDGSGTDVAFHRTIFGGVAA